MAKTKHSENIHGIQPHQFMANRETMETVTDFIILDSKITVDGDCRAMKLKDACSLEGKL